MPVMFTAERIRELRLAMGMTMAGFGDLLGVAESTVSLWESGRRHPKFATQVRLNELAKECSLEMTA